MGAPTRGPGDARRDRIVGRRREIDALRTWLNIADGGAGRLVLCGGEPGIGKTRLGQELAGIALASGIAVAWGRCVETEGAPAYWPWRQVLRSLGVDPDTVLAGDAESPHERFRVFDQVTDSVCAGARKTGLVVILDDIHWGDEPSLLLLRHLSDQIGTTRLLVFATFRDGLAQTSSPRIYPDLLRSPEAECLDLRGFDLAEVREHLSADGDTRATDAQVLLELTGGNPLFVREVARAMADGSWRPDRPPRTVLEVVGARLDRVSAGCRRLVQAAAIVGRDFSLHLVALALDEPVEQCLPFVDEAILCGLLDRVGDVGDYRFVHALTRDAVEASLATADRIALHRAVATATETKFTGDLSDHLADIARHWAELAPYGAAVTAREWAVRAGSDAVRRLAYEDGVRLYRAALGYDPVSLTEIERCQIQLALGRAAYLAGDLRSCVDAAVAAATAARAAGDPELSGEAALVLEAVPDPGVNAVAKQLCEEALAGLGDTSAEALRARLLAQRSHLAFYDGQQGHSESLSAAALDLARRSQNDRALADALRARQEACPGPAGRTERLHLAMEMLALAQRTNDPRSAMWAELWRIDALIGSGQVEAADEELASLRLAVERVGGPVSAWHLDRVWACIAQAQGRYADAAAIGRRGYDRMRVIEPAPATGSYLALQSALAGHVGVTEETIAFVRRPFDPPPRFTTMARLSRAYIFTLAGLTEPAAVSYQQAGPLDSWSLPVFFVAPGYVYGTLAAIGLGRHDDLSVLLDRLAPFRGEHVVGDGVSYLGPVELTLGRGAAALGRFDRAVDDLTFAAEQADRAGAPGFAAEARYHLARSLLGRSRPGDHDRAMGAARDADRLARALGMAAYTERSGALVAQLTAQLEGNGPPTLLSPRETEISRLVAEGLTNRQIAERLVISERTAQNHVQHILIKLGFATRSQIAAWSVRRGE